MERVIAKRERYEPPALAEYGRLSVRFALRTAVK